MADFRLDEGDRRAYRVLWAAAIQAVEHDRGGEAQYEAVMRSLTALEGFVRERYPKAKAGEYDFLQAVFSHHAGINNYQTIPELLELATKDRFAMAAAQPGDLEAQIMALAAGGALIVRHPDTCFIPTDPQDQTIIPGEGEEPIDPRFQNRLTELAEALHAIEYYTDDMIVHVGVVGKDMRRQTPYVILDIPRAGKDGMQVAVNVQVGETSFVYEGIAPPEFYGQLTKTQLRAVPGMHRETYSPTWAQHVCERIQGLSPETKRKKAILELEVQKRRPFPLSVSMIRESCIAHEKASGAPAKAEKWNPDTKKHEPCFFAAGPLQGQSLHTVSQAIRRRLRGLDKEGIPEHVTSIRDFMIWKELIPDDSLTVQKIRESCIAHAAATGEPATAQKWNPDTKKLEPCFFAAEPLEGQGIHAVSLAIRNRYRGLDKEGIPEHVTSIQDFMIWQELIPDDSLTIENIKQSCIAHEKATGEPATALKRNPDTKKQEPCFFAAGSLKGQSIDAVSKAIRKRHRGLDKEGIPEHVTSIREFMIWQELIPDEDKNLTVAMILESCIAHAAATGEPVMKQKKNPEIKKQEPCFFAAGPLEGRSIDAVSLAIRNRYRGLDKEGIPEDVTSIREFLKWQCMDTPARGAAARKKAPTIGEPK